MRVSETFATRMVCTVALCLATGSALFPGSTLALPRTAQDGGATTTTTTTSSDSGSGSESAPAIASPSVSASMLHPPSSWGGEPDPFEFPPLVEELLTGAPKLPPPVLFDGASLEKAVVFPLSSAAPSSPSSSSSLSSLSEPTTTTPCPPEHGEETHAHPGQGEGGGDIIVCLDRRLLNGARGRFLLQHATSLQLPMYMAVDRCTGGKSQNPCTHKQGSHCWAKGSEASSSLFSNWGPEPLPLTETHIRADAMRDTAVLFERQADSYVHTEL